MVITKNKINVGHYPSGLALDVEYYHLQGKEGGKKIYIQAGIHGGEITYRIVDKLYTFLSNHEFKGEIVLVPCCNPASWMQRTYFSTFGKFDLYMGKDWNHNFPGKADGSFGEKICHVLSTLAMQSEVILDLHTSRSSFPFLMLTNVHTDKTISGAAHKQIEYSKAMGIEYVMAGLEFNPSDGTDYYSSQGIPAITVECGSHDSYEPEYIEDIYQGILRLFAHCDIIDKSYTQNINNEIKFYSTIKNYRATNGGFIKFKKNIGESFKKGDVLFEIFSSHQLGHTIEVRAEEDGIVQKIAPTYIARPGDDVVTIIPSSDIQTVL